MSSGRLIDRILSRAKTYNQQIAVSDVHGSTVSYAALSDRIAVISEYLRIKGLKAGGRVALLQHKSIDSLCCLLAVAANHAAYIPIDPGMSVHRIQRVLDDCDPDFFIADPKLFLSEIPCQLDISERIPETENSCLTILGSDHTPEPELAYILYTSGSTGHPKGVCVSYEATSAFIDWSIATFHPRTGDNVASIAPFHFDLSVFDIYASLLCGCNLHLFDSAEIRNVRLMAQELSERNINTIYATPSFLSALLQFGKVEKFKWNSIRTVLFAGEVFPVQHLHQLMSLWSTAQYFNLYGPTETNVCTWKKIVREENRKEPYSIGQPCSNHEYIISPEGELWIGGPHVANGYLNQPVLTAERFFQQHDLRWFKTGDLVSKDERGALVYRGRIDRMVKRHGYRIEPAEVERALLFHAGVSSCVVCGVAFHEGETRLIAFAAGTQVPNIVHANAFLQQHLPDYMLPDAILPVESIPTLSTGKINFSELQQLYLAMHGKE